MKLPTLSLRPRTDRATTPKARAATLTAQAATPTGRAGTPTVPVTITATVRLTTKAIPILSTFLVNSSVLKGINFFNHGSGNNDDYGSSTADSYGSNRYGSSGDGFGSNNDTYGSSN